MRKVFYLYKMDYLEDLSSGARIISLTPLKRTYQAVKSREGIICRTNLAERINFTFELKNKKSDQLYVRRFDLK